MAKFKCNMASGGGGSSIKSGTTEAASPSETITINTGLSTISKFVWMAVTNNGTYRTMIAYDKNVSTTTCDCACIGLNAGSHQKNIGAAVVAQVPSLTSISGGTIVLTMASGNLAGTVKAGYWYAE